MFEMQHDNNEKRHSHHNEQNNRNHKKNINDCKNQQNHCQKMKRGIWVANPKTVNANDGQNNEKSLMISHDQP